MKAVSAREIVCQGAGAKGRIAGNTCVYIVNSRSPPNRHSSQFVSIRSRAKSAIRTDRWSSVSRESRFRAIGARSPATCLRRNISARPASRAPQSRSRGRRAGISVAPCRRRRRNDGRNLRAPGFHRMAGTWTYWGWKGGYFDTEADARAFYDELCYMLATQRLRPTARNGSTPGLHWAYGIEGPSQGHYYVDPATGVMKVDDRPTNIPSRTPASSRACPTISSTKAASWTSGCARRASSNMVRARARIFPCAARANPFGRRKIVRPDELPQDRRPCGRRDQIRAVPRAARPRW